MRKKSVLFFVIVSLTAIMFSPSSIAAAKKKSEKKPNFATLEINDDFYDKAWRNFQIGNADDRQKVISALKKIIKKAPEEFMAYYYLGIMSKEEGNDSAALKYLETAKLGFPKSADVNRRIAEILYSKGKEEEALEYYNQALELDPMEPDSLCRVGIFELENGNYDKALILLSRSKEKKPGNPENLMALASVQIEKNLLKDAIENLELVLRFDEKDAEAHLLMAKAYEKKNQPDKAAAELKLAKKYGKKNEELKEIIGYDFAKNLFDAGKVKEAISEYKKQIKKSDDPGFGYYKLADAYEYSGDEKEAIKNFIKAYEYDSSYGDGIMKAAQIYEKQENWDKAYEMYSMLSRDKKFKDEAKLRKKDLEQMAENSQKLELEKQLNYSDTTDHKRVEILEEMYYQDKKNPETLRALYEHYEKNGYYDEAIKYYRKYAKVSSITGYELKQTVKEMREKMKADNLVLYNDKKALDYKYSSARPEDLDNIAFNGETDRLKEEALLILLARKETKKERKYMEGLLEFYESKGNLKGALKAVSILKRNGFYTSGEAKSKRDELKSRFK